MDIDVFGSKELSIAPGEARARIGLLPKLA